MRHVKVPTCQTTRKPPQDHQEVDEWSSGVVGRPFYRTEFQIFFRYFADFISLSSCCLLFETLKLCTLVYSWFQEAQASRTLPTLLLSF